MCCRSQTSAHGLMFMVLIFESIVLGPLIRTVVYYGMKLSLHFPHLHEDPGGIILRFTVAFAVLLTHFAVVLCLARGICYRSTPWLAPYYIWKPVTLLGLSAMLTSTFYENELRLFTHETAPNGRNPDALNRFDGIFFLNHVTGFIFNQYGADMSWEDFRNEAMIPPMAFGLALGLSSLTVSIFAGFRYHGVGKFGDGDSSNSIDEDITYRHYYPPNHRLTHAQANQVTSNNQPPTPIHFSPSSPTPNNNHNPSHHSKYY